MRIQSKPIRVIRWASLFAENFKCFGPGQQGFEVIKPVNVIIGRNNSGKTALIDILHHAVTSSNYHHRGYRGQIPLITLKYLLTSESIDELLSSESGYEHNRAIYQPFGDMEVIMPVVEGTTYKAKMRHLQQGYELEEGSNNHADVVLRKVRDSLSQYVIRRVAAERDIRPETERDGLDVAENGDGATNAIQAIINRDDLPSELVEEALRRELNEIFRPDADFTRITVQRENRSGAWEIHLEEKHKGRVRMSETGSGFKTVLLVLINLHVLPGIARRNPSSYLFAFEEIENNLHPALQKRLFKYIRKIAIENQTTFFLTTHSHVVVDLFSRDDQAQIIHVVHDGEKATASTVSNFLHRRNIFTDLDVRASDLLQTNAIVWVEGPSDRIYVNRWIELWSDGELKENVDYQCVTYGGSLLANYTFGTPEGRRVEVEEDFIQALKVNPSFVVLMDSDKRDEADALKPRVERVAEEAGTTHGMVWITAGREVENYIPVEALRSFLGKPDLAPPPKHVSFFGVIEKHGGGKLERKKTDLAKVVCKHLTRDILAHHLDLADRLEEVCDKIRVWNRERPPISPA